MPVVFCFVLKLRGCTFAYYTALSARFKGFVILHSKWQAWLSTLLAPERPPQLLKFHVSRKHIFPFYLPTFFFLNEEPGWDLNQCLSWTHSLSDRTRTRARCLAFMVAPSSPAATQWWAWTDAAGTLWNGLIEGKRELQFSPNSAQTQQNN